MRIERHIGRTETLRRTPLSMRSAQHGGVIAPGVKRQRRRAGTALHGVVGELLRDPTSADLLGLDSALIAAASPPPRPVEPPERSRSSRAAERS